MSASSSPDPLSILTVHAHPDDEASKGAGTIRRYADEGIRTTLVCCTGGEEGDVLNPAMDRPEVVDNLKEVRRAELAKAAEIIGYDEVVMLGYRDSGMPESEANANPEAFANVALGEAVERLVAVIRRVRPQVIVTYPLNQKRYPHPDHLRVTEICLPAFERAGEPDWKPELGPAFQPFKMYATVWSGQRLKQLHQAFLDHGLESPIDKKWLKTGSRRRQRIDAVLEVDNSYRRKALLAHATQVDPKSPFWFGLPDEVMDSIHPFEEYFRIEPKRAASEPVEDDLFAGLRSESPVVGASTSQRG